MAVVAASGSRGSGHACGCGCGRGRDQWLRSWLKVNSSLNLKDEVIV